MGTSGQTGEPCSKMTDTGKDIWINKLSLENSHFFDNSKIDLIYASIVAYIHPVVPLN